MAEDIPLGLQTGYIVHPFCCAAGSSLLRGKCSRLPSRILRSDLASRRAYGRQAKSQSSKVVLRNFCKGEFTELVKCFENFCNNIFFFSFILRAFASLREISISEFRACDPFPFSDFLPILMNNGSTSEAGVARSFNSTTL
jgi:hypothetical protein